MMCLFREVNYVRNQAHCIYQRTTPILLTTAASGRLLLCPANPAFALGYDNDLGECEYSA